MEQEYNFDPMTGQPIKKEGVTPEPEMNFDPMTGQPLTPAGYDPMTGQPIYKAADPSAAKKKNRLPLLIGAIVAGAAAVACIVIAGVMNGAFLHTSDKVLLAAKNTLSEGPEFMKDLGLQDASSMIGSGKYTLAFTADTREAAIEGKYICTREEKQLRAEVSAAGERVEINAALTDSQLMLSVPVFSDDVFVYNYKEEADGYIADLLESRGVRMEDLSEALSSLYSQKEQEKQSAKQSATLIKQIRDLKWEKTDAQSFDIDGKSRKAKGYEVTFTADDAENMLEAVEDYLDENYEGAIDDVHSDMRELYRRLRSMPDVECVFYIYKNRLAAITMDFDREGELELVFEGGDFRMQNMELEISDRYDSYTLELDGETDGPKESYELTEDGDTVFELEYNSESGKYELLFDDAEWIIDGRIMSERGVAGATVEYSGYGEFYSFGFELSRDAKTEKITGDQVDVMELSEQELLELVSGYQYRASEPADF